MATLGSKMRKLAAKQQAEKKVAAKIDKQGRPLVSETSLSTPEPRTPVGVSAYKKNQGVVKNVSGGRHHGVVANIADSVGYMLAEHAHDNPNSSHTGTAYDAMERAYLHLGMHHSSHLMGNHAAAAAHLRKASEAIKYAMNRIGGSLKGGIQNAYGEKIRRADAEATLDHAVTHYATHHGVSTAGRAEVEKPKLVETETDWREANPKRYELEKYGKTVGTPRAAKGGRLSAEEGLPKRGMIANEVKFGTKAPSGTVPTTSETRQEVFDRIKPDAFKRSK